MKKNNRSFIARLYSNKSLMFGVSVLLNVALLALIVWLSRYAKIKGNIFASVIAAVVLVGLIVNVIFLLAYSKNLKIFRQLFFFVASILLVLSLAGTVYIVRAELSLNKLVNVDGEETVDYSVISFSPEYTEDNMGENKIGYLRQSEEFETIFKDKVRDHSRTIQYVEYDDYNDLLTASMEGLIQYGLVPLNYSRLAEGFEDESFNPFEEASVLFSFSTVVSDDFSNVNVTKEPFTVILLGNNEGLSDSIIVATVNPKTLRVTMTSLARDSYVPIACYANNSRDKLNHSRGRGRQCLVDTVEDFLDIEIDFYFETDFYALQKIIDALGGIEIDSPLSFAGSFPIEGKQNEYETITVPAGLNLLDGKQAVTFARERHSFGSGDFTRQLNQQYVIREIATKLIKERNPERLVSVLEGASKNLKMNISVDDLTALLGYAIAETSSSQLDPMNTFRIIQTQITGDTPFINGMSVVLPYQSDLDEAKRVIKQNLQTETELLEETSFTFSINKPFKLARTPYNDGTTIGKGSGQVNETNEQFVVPNFTRDWSKSRVKEWGNINDVEITLRVIDNNSPDFQDSYSDGQIIYQSVDAGTYKKKPGGVSISIVEFVEVEPEQPVVPEEKPDEPEEKPGNGDQVLEQPEAHKGMSLDEIKAYAARNHLSYSEQYDETIEKGYILNVNVVGKKGDIAGYIVVTLGSKEPTVQNKPEE